MYLKTTFPAVLAIVILHAPASRRQRGQRISIQSKSLRDIFHSLGTGTRTVDCRWLYNVNERVGIKFLAPLADRKELKNDLKDVSRLNIIYSFHLLY